MSAGSDQGTVTERAAPELGLHGLEDHGFPSVTVAGTPRHGRLLGALRLDPGDPQRLGLPHEGAGGVRERALHGDCTRRKRGPLRAEVAAQHASRAQDGERARPDEHDRGRQLLLYMRGNEGGSHRHHIPHNDGSAD
eukprot:CAMPEP_0198596358 /NCGR_PEP_ID=MMETSP1462-20131121/143069_1 /TAXON_ID=1333877 /ORGANISM="Brandtodinium nutriculum, Strain RCC3387" /LENGTH=136 /DNA_ID=CAMNT_0044327995 /DNA_START=152 /DNA_END=563 /DNA_ORIENTATION=-